MGNWRSRPVRVMEPVKQRQEPFFMNTLQMYMNIPQN